MALYELHMYCCKTFENLVSHTTCNKLAPLKGPKDRFIGEVVSLICYIVLLGPYTYWFVMLLYLVCHFNWAPMDWSCTLLPTILVTSTLSSCYGRRWSNLLQHVLLLSAQNLTGHYIIQLVSKRLHPVYSRYTDLNAASLNLCSLQKPNKDDYHAITAYGTSKLCNMLFGLELNRILIPVGVTCNVVHPGNLLSTNMLRNAGMFYNLLRMIMWPFVKSVVSANKCMRTN